MIRKKRRKVDELLKYVWKVVHRRWKVVQPHGETSYLKFVYVLT